MEKLKSQEIQALARVILSNYSREKSKINETLVKEILNSKEVVAVNKAISSLKSKYKDFSINAISSYNVENHVKNRNYYNKSHCFNQRDVEDMIILEQLDCKDIESLKKAIIKKLQTK